MITTYPTNYSIIYINPAIYNNLVTVFWENANIAIIS